MVSAVARSMRGDVCSRSVTTISGSRLVAPAAPASSVPGRAGIPAANDECAERERGDERGTSRYGPRPPARVRDGESRAQRRDPRRAARARRALCAAQTSASDAEDRDLRRELRRLRRDQERREQSHRRRRTRGARRRLAGVVFGSVIMKKRKTRISGEVTSSHQNCLPSIGPTCQARRHRCGRSQRARRYRRRTPARTRRRSRAGGAAGG